MKIQFKHDVDPMDLLKLTQNCAVLLTAVYDYLEERGLPMTITSLQGDRKNVKAVSRTHETGRAFDIRIKDIPSETVAEIADYFNVSYRNIAAISARSGKPHCAVVKPDHIHFQVRK